MLEPPAGGGEALEELALAQAEHELAPRAWTAGARAVGVGDGRPVHADRAAGGDGVGDPQVAWLVEADGVRVLHLGDTMFHGYWWRMALRHGPFDVVLVPVNGAVVGFPHRRPASPLPVALDPAQAAIAAELLGARLAIPIHAEGYEIDGIYEPVAGRGRSASPRRPPSAACRCGSSRPARRSRSPTALEKTGTHASPASPLGSARTGSPLAC